MPTSRHREQNTPPIGRPENAHRSDGEEEGEGEGEGPESRSCPSDGGPAVGSWSMGAYLSAVAPRWAAVSPLTLHLGDHAVTT